MPSFRALANTPATSPTSGVEVPVNNAINTPNFEPAPIKKKSFRDLVKPEQVAPVSKWQGAADVLNEPGILNSASKLFGNTAKFIGGAAENVANALTAKGKDVQALNESNQALNDIDQEAIQKARILHAAGETEKAKKLLEVVKSHGTNITLNDLPLFKTGQENVKDIVGAGVGTALELGSFASGTGLPPSLKLKVPPLPGKAGEILDKFKTVAPKTFGAIKGATRASAEASLYGASAGLQQENPTFSSVMGSALDYATNPIVLATGGLIGGMAGGLEARVANRPKQIAKAVDDLEEKYMELASGKSMKNKIDKAAIKTEMKNLAGTEGTTPVRTLAEDGIIPNQKGTMIDSLNQAEQYRQKLKPFNELNRQVLRELDNTAPKVSLTQLEEDAVNRVKTSQNINAGTFDGLEKDIRQEVAALRAHYGDEISYETLGDIKSARWGKTRFDATRPLLSDANYAIGKSAQQKIEQTAKDFGNEEVAQLNRYIGDRLEAAKFLESLNGKVVKGGRLQKYVFSIIGSSIGTTPLGRILGALGGNELANVLISNQVSNALKRRILAQIEHQNPETYARTVKWLVDKKINPELMLSLPAPKPGAARSEISTIYQEPLNIREGKKNIAPENFVPGQSGIVNAPPPTPGEQVMRPGQPALPYTPPGEPPIIPPYRDTSGIVPNGEPAIGTGIPVQIRPGQATLPPPAIRLPRKDDSGIINKSSQSKATKIHRPPKRYIEGKIVK